MSLPSPMTRRSAKVWPARPTGGTNSCSLHYHRASANRPDISLIRLESERRFQTVSPGGRCTVSAVIRQFPLVHHLPHTGSWLIGSAEIVATDPDCAGDHIVP